MRQYTEEWGPLIAIAPKLSENGVQRIRIQWSGSEAKSAVAVDSRSLLLDGKSWLPVMGEFHYARYPETAWRDELIKMKLGGVDIVASYVFWIHHEEIEGAFDWTGRRDLRRFVQICADLDLTVIVRCGPWCHGECRNGGLPNWLLDTGVTIRSDDPIYLNHSRLFYAEIAKQLQGLYWRNGGPVVAIQCENEFDGPAQHLLNLKKIAREVGIDVPFYTRTGWPELATPMPFGEFLPFFGAYPDGFWDRALVEMPPGFADNYLFRTIRNDASVATDQLGMRDNFDESDLARYPYFTCELGGGMASSYHRRIRIDPRDIEALALVKLGSGNNLQGYYMYHGGTNPDGALSTLQESQATGYWNDLPLKSYDFQAPLGEFGQVREHYHRLRKMHLFLRDFGADLTAMPALLPEDRPRDATDVDTLRWSVRTDGYHGFIFVNNYQRLQPMPQKSDVQFEVQLPGGAVCVPAAPTTIAADSSFFWPVNLEIEGICLKYATAQPICRLADEEVSYFVFAQTGGAAAEFVFGRARCHVDFTIGDMAETASEISIRGIRPGRGEAIRLRGNGGQRIVIALLSTDDSLCCYKARIFGRERLLLTRAMLLTDGDSVSLSSTDSGAIEISVLPAPPNLAAGDSKLAPAADGMFCKYSISAQPRRPIEVGYSRVQHAGPAREVRLGSQGVAEAPSDEDFGSASVWRLNVPQAELSNRRALMRIRYRGDAARLYAGERLLTDNFYNGADFEVGLWPFAALIDGKHLFLKILPLRKDAPIYLPRDAWPDFADSDVADMLCSVEMIEQREIVLVSTGGHAPPVQLDGSAQLGCVGN